MSRILPSQSRRLPLVAHLLLPLFLLGPLLIFGAAWLISQTLYAGLTTDGGLRVSTQMNTIARALSHMDTDTEARAFLSSLRVSAGGPVRALLLSRADGRVLADSEGIFDGRLREDLATDASVARLLDLPPPATGGWSVSRQGADLDGLHHLNLPWGDDGTTPASLYVHFDIAAINEAIMARTTVVVLTSLAIWAILLLLLHRQINVLITRPLATLRARLGEHFGAPPAPAAPGGAPGEINLLVHSLEQSLAQLDQANARRRAVDATVSVAIMLLDPAGEVLEVNPRWTDCTGLEAGAARDGRWLDAVHAEDRAAVRALIDSILHPTEAAPPPAPFRLRSPHGHLTWVLPSHSALPGAAGHVLTLVDITPRIEAEEQLRQALDQSALLATIVEQSPVSVIRTDERRRIIWVNHAFELLTGYRLDEARGTTPGQLLQGAKTDATAVARLREALNRRETAQATLLNYHKDGTPYWVDLHISPLRDHRGEHCGYVGVQSDVTARENGQRALARSERQLRERLDLLSLISRASTRLMADSMAEVGALLGVDRVFIFQIDRDKPAVWHNTHEWCATDIPPQIENLQNVPLPERRDWWLRQLAEKGHVAINSLDEIPVEDIDLRVRLAAQDVQSVLAVPLRWGGAAQGMLGLAAVRARRQWTRVEVFAIESLANIFAAALERCHREDELVESAQRHRLLFETMVQGVVIQERDGTISAINPAGRLILGVEERDAVGRDSADPRWDSIREDGTPFSAPEHPPMVALATGRVVRDVVMGIHNPATGQRRWININATPYFAKGEETPARVYVTFEDITARRQLLADLQGALAREERRALTLTRAATGAPLKEILASLVAELEAAHPDYMASIMLLNDAGTRLLHAAAPKLSPAFVAAVAEVRVGPHVGTCGLAAGTRRVAISPCIATDPNWAPFAAIAAACGLGSCWSHPIIASDGSHVLGTLAVYHDREYTPTAEDLRAAGDAAQFAAIAIERRRAQDALHRLNAELEQRVAERTREVRRQAAALAAAVEGVVLVAEGRITYSNPAQWRLFTRSPEELAQLTPTELFHPDHRGAIAHALVTTTENSPWSGEVIARTADGHDFEAAVEIVAVLDEGHLIVTRDVTERNAALRRIREANSFLATLLDTLPLRIFWKDPHTRYLGANEAFARSLATTPQRLIGQRDADLNLPPADVERYQAEDHRVFETGQPIVAHVYKHTTADGTTVWAEVSKVPLRDSHGAIIGLLGAAQDVTAREEAREALRHSEERWQLALRGTNDGIWDWDIANNRVYYSTRWCRMRGRTEQGFDGPPDIWSDGIHPDDHARVLETLHAHLRHETPHYQAEYRIRHADGHYLWVLDRGQALWDANDRPIRAAGSITDITARREAETRLRELSQQLALSLEAGDIGCWAYDLVDGTLTWDDRVYTLYGVPTDFAVTYDSWAAFIPPEELAQAQQGMQHAIAEGGTFEAVFNITTGDGQARTLQNRGIVVRDADGTPRRVLGINYDITALIEREKSLQLLNRQLAHATRMKDEFLASMSHELRTPLNGILGLSEAMREGIYGTLTDKQLRSLQRIEDSGRHLLDLINDILDLAKIEAGKVELSHADIEVAELVRGVAGVVEPLAAARRIDFRWDLDPEPTLLHVDPRRFRQIMLNLLSNAIKFTPEGGGVTATFRADRATRTATFAVRDTGPGIPEEKLPLLFQPFTQLEDTLTRHHGGTGLGLAIVKRLATLHDGTTAVQSTPGTGSTFAVTIPWNPPATPSPSQSEIPRPSVAAAPGTGLAAGALVLVAEDNETNYSVLEDFLTARGLRCLHAPDGAEAVRLATELQPALILMDVQMPHLDGLEATRRLRAQPATAKIPIITLTAFAMPGDRERCLAAGANEYLAKPISLRALDTYLRRFIPAPTA